MNQRLRSDPRLVPRARAGADGGPRLLGFPAEFSDDAPPPRGRLVVLPCPDWVGGSAMGLAGLAAGLSLLMPWTHSDGPSGMTLAWRGFVALRDGFGDAVRGELWPPVAVVLGGVLLLLLGLLTVRPARTHRVSGVLALFLAIGTAAAVVVLLADAGWRVTELGLGAWFAVAVPVLGLLGALKAMLTAPRVTLVGR
jgi:hypothetical protein